jgi:hypothetical protein
MILTPELPRRRSQREGGFVMTFWEVLIAVIIVAVVFGVIFDGYITSAKIAQWTGYSLAAQSLAAQSVEQARSAVWDIALQKTEVTNMTLLNKNVTYNGVNWTMTGYTTNVLDIPWKGTNYVIATNYITVQSFFENGATNPWVQLQSVTVQTVWPFDAWGNFSLLYYTNTVCTYIAPDNRDPSTLGD